MRSVHMIGIILLYPYVLLQGVKLLLGIGTYYSARHTVHIMVSVAGTLASCLYRQGGHDLSQKCIYLTGHRVLSYMYAQCCSG